MTPKSLQSSSPPRMAMSREPYHSLLAVNVPLLHPSTFQDPCDRGKAEAAMAGLPGSYDPHLPFPN